MNAALQHSWDTESTEVTGKGSGKYGAGIGNDGCSSYGGSWHWQAYQL